MSRPSQMPFLIIPTTFLPVLASYIYLTLLVSSLSSSPVVCESRSGSRCGDPSDGRAVEAASLLRVLCLRGEGGGVGILRQSFIHTNTPTATTNGTAAKPAPTPTTTGTAGPRSRSRAGSVEEAVAPSVKKHDKWWINGV